MRLAFLHATSTAFARICVNGLAALPSTLNYFQSIDLFCWRACKVNHWINWPLLDSCQKCAAFVHETLGLVLATLIFSTLKIHELFGWSPKKCILRKSWFPYRFSTRPKKNLTNFVIRTMLTCLSCQF